MRRWSRAVGGGWEDEKRQGRGEHACGQSTFPPLARQTNGPRLVLTHIVKRHIDIHAGHTES